MQNPYSTLSDTETAPGNCELRVANHTVSGIPPETLHHNILNRVRPDREPRFFQENFPIPLSQGLQDFFNQISLIAKHPRTLFWVPIFTLPLIVAAIVFFKEGGVEWYQNQFLEAKYTEVEREDQRSQLRSELTADTYIAILTTLFLALAWNIRQDIRRADAYELTWLRDTHEFLKGETDFSQTRMTAAPERVAEGLELLSPKFCDMMTALMTRAGKIMTASSRDYTIGLAGLVISLQQYTLEGELTRHLQAKALETPEPPLTPSRSPSTDDYEPAAEASGEEEPKSLSGPLDLGEMVARKYAHGQELQSSGSNGEQAGELALKIKKLEKTLKRFGAEIEDQQLIDELDTLNPRELLTKRLARLELLINNLEKRRRSSVMSPPAMQQGFAENIPQPSYNPEKHINFVTTLPSDLIAHLRKLTGDHSSPPKACAAIITALMNDAFMKEHSAEKATLIATYLNSAWMNQRTSYGLLNEAGQKAQKKDAKTVAALKPEQQLALFELLIGSADETHQAVAGAIFWNKTFATSRQQLLEAYLDKPKQQDKERNFLYTLFAKNNGAATALFNTAPDVAVRVLKVLAGRLAPGIIDTPSGHFELYTNEMLGIAPREAHHSERLTDSYAPEEEEKQTGLEETKGSTPAESTSNERERTQDPSHGKQPADLTEPLIRSLLWNAGLTEQATVTLCEALFNRSTPPRTYQTLFSIANEQELANLFQALVRADEQNPVGLRIFQHLLYIDRSKAFELILILSGYGLRRNNSATYYKPFVDFIRRLCKDPTSPDNLLEHLIQQLGTVCQFHHNPTALQPWITRTAAALMIAAASSDDKTPEEQFAGIRAIQTIMTQTFTAALRNDDPLRIVVEENAIDPAQDLAAVAAIMQTLNTTQAGNYLAMLQQLRPSEKERTLNPGLNPAQQSEEKREHQKTFSLAVFAFAYGRALARDFERLKDSLSCLWAEEGFSDNASNLSATLERVSINKTTALDLIIQVLINAMEQYKGFDEAQGANRLSSINQQGTAHPIKLIAGSLKGLSTLQLQQAILRDDFLDLLRRAHEASLVLPEEGTGHPQAENPLEREASLELKAALLYSYYQRRPRYCGDETQYQEQLCSIGLSSRNTLAYLGNSDGTLRQGLCNLLPETGNAVASSIHRTVINSVPQQRFFSTNQDQTHLLGSSPQSNNTCLMM